VAPELVATSHAPVEKLVIVWHNQVIGGIDPLNHGEPMYGLAGRVYLSGHELSEMLPADGRLVVELYALLPEQPQGPPVRQGQWVIEKDTLNGKCLSKDVFGQGYTLNLPWPSYRPDVTRLEIRTRYEPAKGMPVYDRSLVTLGNGLGGAPAYSNRTETGDGRLVSTQTRPPTPPQAQAPVQQAGGTQAGPQLGGYQPAANPGPPTGGAVQSFQPPAPFPGSLRR
jgi:hypothetical protein